jgi:hypothetical protein
LFKLSESSVILLQLNRKEVRFVFFCAPELGAGLFAFPVKPAFFAKDLK